jgi:hypothetical protein
MKKTEASNQWNYFQSKSTKQALAEFARDTSSEDRRQEWQKKVSRYDQEKGEILLIAQKLEADAVDWDEKWEAQMHQHHRWEQATTALQVSIALPAMTLLTKRKWVGMGHARSSRSRGGRWRFGGNAHLATARPRCVMRRPPGEGYSRPRATAKTSGCQLELIYAFCP